MVIIIIIIIIAKSLDEGESVFLRVRYYSCNIIGVPILYVYNSGQQQRYLVLIPGPSARGTSCEARARTCAAWVGGGGTTAG